MEKSIENENVIQLIRDEIASAERNLLSWDVNWHEKYSDVYVPKSCFDDTPSIDDEINKKIGSYGINVYRVYIDKLNRLPIKIIRIDDKYDCEASVVEWNNITTHNSTRNIEFRNDGDILLSKDSKRKKGYSYDAEYNVLSDNFSLDMRRISSADKYFSPVDRCSISVEDDRVIKKCGSIVIIDDLSTGKKTLQIGTPSPRRRDGARGVLFEATYDEEGNLEKSSLVLNTFKCHGKVNGTYRLDASKKKGVRANFYSRKGKRVDLSSNPLICESLKKMALLYFDGDLEKNIISEYFDVMQEHIEMGFNNTSTTPVLGDLGMDLVSDMDKRFIELLKTIKGELPLSGLTERVEKLLDKLEYKKGTGPKVLKLSSTNTNNIVS